MRLRQMTLAFVSIAAFSACSSDPQRPPPAGDGQTVGAGSGGGSTTKDGGSSDADIDVDAGQQICNTLANSSLVIDRLGVVGDPPVGTGGTISDGRYELTDYRIFVGAGGVGGPTGVTASSAMVIASGKIEQVLKVGGNTPATEKRVITSYNATASTLLRTNICPSDGAAAQYQFTANDASITITDTLSKEQFVFTKR